MNTDWTDKLRTKRKTHTHIPNLVDACEWVSVNALKMRMFFSRLSCASPTNKYNCSAISLCFGFTSLISISFWLHKSICNADFKLKFKYSLIYKIIIIVIMHFAILHINNNSVAVVLCLAGTSNLIWRYVLVTTYSVRWAMTSANWLKKKMNNNNK